MKKTEAELDLERIFDAIQLNELTNPKTAAIRILNAINRIVDESMDFSELRLMLASATDSLVNEGYQKRPIHPKAMNIFKERQVWIKAFVESWRDVGYPVPQGTNPHLELTLRVPGTSSNVVVDTAYATILSNLSET